MVSMFWVNCGHFVVVFLLSVCCFVLLYLAIVLLNITVLYICDFVFLDGGHCGSRQGCPWQQGSGGEWQVL